MQSWEAGAAFLNVTNLQENGLYRPGRSTGRMHQVPSSTKTKYRFTSAMHITALTNNALQSPPVSLYCTNYNTANKTGALIKTTNYTKYCDKASCCRHVESATCLKSINNLNFKLSFLQHLLSKQSTYLSGKPKC